MFYLDIVMNMTDSDKPSNPITVHIAQHTVLLGEHNEQYFFLKKNFVGHIHVMSNN